MTTLSANTQPLATAAFTAAADSVRNDAGASAATTTTATTIGTKDAKKAVKKDAKKTLAKKETATGSLSHSDSLFFFPTDTTLAHVCRTVIDERQLLSPSAFTKQYRQAAAKADSTHVTVAQAQQVTVLKEPTPRGVPPLRPYSGGVVGLFVIAMVVISIVRFTGRTFYHDLFGFLGSSIGWKRLEQSQYLQLSINFLLLNLIYIVMLSALTIEGTIVFSPGSIGSGDALEAMGIVAAGTCLFYVGRAIVDAVLAYAFKIEDRLQTLNLYRRASRAIIGVCLAPCVLIMPFVSTQGCMIVTGFATLVIIVVTLMRVGKTMRINMNDFPTVSYFILYLCIVEAAPIVCIVRIVKLLFPDINV